MPLSACSLSSKFAFCRPAAALVQERRFVNLHRWVPPEIHATSPESRTNTIDFVHAAGDEWSLQVSGSDGVSKVHLILPHKANATATVPVNFTLTYPADPQITLDHPKPLVLLLNGRFHSIQLQTAQLIALFCIWFFTCRKRMCDNTNASKINISGLQVRPWRASGTAALLKGWPRKDLLLPLPTITGLFRTRRESYPVSSLVGACKVQGSFL